MSSAHAGPVTGAAGEAGRTRSTESDCGATALEYAMLIAFIAIAIVGAVSLFAGDLGDFISAIGEKVAGWASGLT